MTIEEAPPRAGRREWAGLAALALATLMITFDMFVLLLALPEITADLRPSTVEQLWILDIYGFLVGGFLITMGTLGDRIGRRKLLMIGAASFAVASLLCAFAPTAELLIVGRALLGIAGSTLAPSTLALITNMFQDPKQRGVAIGIWAGGFTLGSILGPVVGGVMLAQFWWGSVFLLAVPVMVLLLVVCPLLVPEFRNPDAGKLDLTSALLSVLAIVAFIYGLKEVTRHGWQVLPIIVGVAGIVLALVFVRRQLHLTDPFMDLRLFDNRSFSTMLVGLVLYALIGGSSMYYITQFLQSVSGMTPLMAAFCLLPGMVVATISATVAPLLGQRIRPAYLISGGIAGIIIPFAMFSQLGTDSSPTTLIVGFAIMGLCEGPLLSLGTNLVVGSAPPEKAGSSASMTQVANEAGSSLGVAVMGSVGAAVYVAQLDDTAPAGLSGDAVEAARENVASALTVASDLPPQLGDQLATAAKDAFASGMNVFAIVCMAILVVAAVVIAALLKHVPPTGAEEAGTDDTGADDTGEASAPADPSASSTDQADARPAN
ncbi:DHA2 family multidrug resistance protein-like MFS transporter [Amycolatopsis cihanbeyliensis]|uniref:DHA2 family multidrug resistance protein-like MFS transporter n=1 Tax=Amycolatopsis cihanbeyliensis TaxID=1128664 RepID=A0A542DQB6_AMYCI|nr:DHA2 family multidrug resistance protein-like MFS transporter [Amycolatopsis cihanbeyliensis]